ncbi:MAG TPA: RluA family pseudouridine synthase [Longimicrobiaceae bacterium]
MANEEDWTELTVEGENESRLDAYLAGRLPLSRSRVAQLIEEGAVLLNGHVPRKRDIPAPGDRISIRIPPPEPSPLTPEPIPFDILYQDTDLLVIDKPGGLVVHPAPGHRGGTLVNALLHEVGDLSGIGGVLRPGIVHRLDKDTSGLMLVAKNDEAHRRLADELRQRRIIRLYVAAAWGHLPAEEMTTDAPIGRHPTDRKRMAVVEGGRRAVTHFRVLERWRAADLVRARLETGRTHQIRVHLAHLGHPVVGDPVYGAARERGFSGPARAWAQEFARRVPRQFLHATELRFVHPRSGEEMRFVSELPDELARAAEWARGGTRAVD